MRVVVTGQVGLDKKPFLARASELAREHGGELAVFNVGKMMYAEAPDVAPGKILDLPLSRLNDLRRSVFKDILAACRSLPNVVVNTHATFRWRHGLFYAFDYDQMKALDADLYVVLVDNIDRVHYRLARDGHVDHTLKDLMVWREEEILTSELLSRIVSPAAGPPAPPPAQGKFFILARGEGDDAAETFVNLLFNRDLKKAYLSYPMTHISAGSSATAEGNMLADIETFRREMRRHFICFDPGDLEEKNLASLALRAAEAGHRTVEAGPPGEKAVMETHQIVDIIPDIDGQIYVRDFKLIDQADMVVAMIPALADGRPAISSGVERELQHAHEAARDTFVIWRPEAEPSPFITETATRMFSSAADAVKFFSSNDYIPRPRRGSLFG